ncbi:MAG: flagella basal body P-ring formation protein FlgA [Nitrospinota bacterium]|nr:MAG: flagella basal body P-ring formation protein FlgA [Nitrospinota bacterium]
MRSLGYWVLGILLLLNTGKGWGEELTIIVRASAMVSGTEVTIGDLAEIRGGDAKVRSRIAGIVIGQAPPPGEDRILYGGYIYTRLKQYGFDPQSLTIQVPRKIRVTRAFQQIESGTIERVVREAIRRQMPWDPQQTRIREIRGIEPVILPPGAVQYEVTFPGNTDFLGPTSFSLLFRVDGNLEKRLYGTAYIEVMEEVVVLTRPVARHAIITASDIRLQRVNLARIPRGVIRDPAAVIGKRARRPLQANAMVRIYEVESLPLIRQGDRVLIVAESPLLKVSTVGEALESGNKGDTIRVRNISSSREVRAIVVDRKTVRVPF